MKDHKSGDNLNSGRKTLPGVTRRPNARQRLAFPLLLVGMLSWAAQGEVLVEDDFAGAAGTSPDTTKFEWGGEVSHDGSGSLGFGTWSVNTSWLQSRTGAVVSAGSTLHLRFRASAYAEGWNPGIYGNGQPRGLRVGNDANNVIEFYSAANSTVGMRVRSSGIGSDQTYAVTPGVSSMHLYGISVTSTSAVFSVDGTVAGTFTANLPAGALNFHVGTFDDYAGNVPVGLDSVSLALTNALVAPEEFTYTISDGAIIITGYNGPGGSVVIPDTINGLPVRSIVGEYFGTAGPYWANVTNITIPNSVTSLGEFAFYHSPSVVSVTIPDSVTSIEGWAFENCWGLTSVRIPDSVTNIGGAAFWNCPFLTDVTIGNSVARIGSAAFAMCSRLTSLVIPDSVTRIEHGAFSESGLANVVVGSSVTNIANEAFSYCNSMTGVYFRGNAPVVGPELFLGANSATVYRLPGATGWPPVPDLWAGRPTALWSPLFLLTVSGGTGGGSYTNGAPVTITASNAPDGQIFDRWTGATQHVASVRSETTVVTMPAQSIGVAAAYRANCFTHTTNAGKITITGYTGSGSAEVIPDTINGLPVTQIGNSAFSYIASLTDVTIGNNVTALGNSAFYRCDNMTNITFGNSVNSIGAWALYGSSFRTITVTEPNSFYSSVEGVLFNKNRTRVVRCPNARSGVFAIPDGATAIGPEAFAWCGGLTNVSIPNGVTSIGYLAFLQSGLAEVNIPASVTSIEAQAIRNCGNLKWISVDPLNPAYCSVDGVLFNKNRTVLIKYPEARAGSDYSVPDSVISIENNAFSYCQGLVNVTMGRSVAAIADYGLYYCLSLRSVFFKGNAPSLGGSYVFTGDSFATIYYLAGATGWGESFGGRPAVLWNPQAQTDDASFGVRTNGFGFDITGSAGIPIVVEACADLGSGMWVYLHSGTLTNGSFSFTDPQWTSYPTRCYRIRSP